MLLGHARFTSLFCCVVSSSLHQLELVNYIIFQKLGLLDDFLFVFNAAAGVLWLKNRRIDAFLQLLPADAGGLAVVVVSFLETQFGNGLLC